MFLVGSLCSLFILHFCTVNIVHIPKTPGNMFLALKYASYFMECCIWHFHLSMTLSSNMSKIKSLIQIPSFEEVMNHYSMYFLLIVPAYFFKEFSFFIVFSFVLVAFEHFNVWMIHQNYESRKFWWVKFTFCLKSMLLKYLFT